MMAGLIEKTVRVRSKRAVIGGGDVPAISVQFWIVTAVRGRKQIGPTHITRSQAVKWARENNYIVLGPQ